MKNIILTILLTTILFSYEITNSNISLDKKEKDYLQNKKELKICLDPNWFPFEGFDKDGKYVGISSDYFKLFQKQLNIPIVPVKTNSWTQTLEFVKNRKCDILTLANQTDDRKKYLNFTKPYLNVPFVVITKTNVNFINNFKHITNKKIGVVNDSALVEILHNKYPNFILVKVKDNKDGILKVKNKILYGFVANMVSVGHILKTNYYPDLKIIARLDDEQSKLAVGIRNDDTILHQIFNKMIANLSLEFEEMVLHKYTYSQYDNITHVVPYKCLKQVLLLIFILILLFFYIQFRSIQLNKKLDKRVKDEVELNRQKELQLIHQSRLAQMGEMLSMISHQWRQPLSSISSIVTTLELKVITDEYDHNYFIKQLNKISDYSQYLSHTITDFRNFYKSNDTQLDTTISSILEDSLKIIQSSLDNNGISVYKHYIDNDNITIYPNEVQQVVISILQNAQDIINARTIENPIINIKVEFINNQYIIGISDNAGGIDENIINKIFDPYFTTKSNSEGTGIGLFIAKKIIENRCQGKIEVLNCNMGVEFKILLQKEIKL